MPKQSAILMPGEDRLTDPVDYYGFVQFQSFSKSSKSDIFCQDEVTPKGISHLLTYRIDEDHQT
jgi:hypothetical protein